MKSQSLCFGAGSLATLVLCIIYACANPQAAVNDATAATAKERDTANLILQDPTATAALKAMAVAAVADAAKHDAKLAEIQAQVSAPATPDQNIIAAGKVGSTFLPPPWDFIVTGIATGAAAFFAARAKGKSETAAAQAEADDAQRHTDQLAKGLAEAKATSPELKAMLETGAGHAALVGAMDKDVQANIAGKMAVN